MDSRNITWRCHSQLLWISQIFGVTHRCLMRCNVFSCSVRQNQILFVHFGTKLASNELCHACAKRCYECLPLQEPYNVLYLYYLLLIFDFLRDCGDWPLFEIYVLSGTVIRLCAGKAQSSRRFLLIRWWRITHAGKVGLGSWCLYMWKSTIPGYKWGKKTVWYCIEYKLASLIIFNAI